MLAKHLVFTPGPPSVVPLENATPKRSAKPIAELSVISEEAVDIAEELDCYQLELENSINEAKSQKKKKRGSTGAGKRNLMDLKNKTNFSFRLNQPEEHSSLTENVVSNAVKVELAEQLTPKIEVSVKITEKVSPAKSPADVVYEEIDDDTSDDEFQFKNPAPFVRTFRRAGPPRMETITKTTEPSKSTVSGIRNSIRKSFRKLIKHQSTKKSEEPDQQSDEPGTNNIFSTLRQSLRRKPTKTKLIVSDSEDCTASVHNI